MSQMFDSACRVHRLPKVHTRDMRHAGDMHVRPNAGKVPMSEAEFVLAGTADMPAPGLKGTREQGFAPKPRYTYTPAGTFNTVRRNGQTVMV